MQLLKGQIEITVPTPYQIPEEQTLEADKLVLAARGIKSITSAGENDVTAQMASDIRVYLKAAETLRLELGEPLRNSLAQLKALVDAHCAPLAEELKRLERLGTIWAQKERDRVVAEEAERQKQINDAAKQAHTAPTKLQQMIASRKLEQIANTPEPVIQRAKGQKLTQNLKWEIDESTGGILALVAARPDLCKIEPKPSAIKAVCNPKFPVPGLKLWWEEEGTYTTQKVAMIAVAAPATNGERVTISQSSLIEKFSYNDGVLHIWFRKGGHYGYNGITPETFKEFHDAESHGKYFLANIKNDYQFTKYAD